jgi:hypothetical protein
MELNLHKYHTTDFVIETTLDISNQEIIKLRQCYPDIKKFKKSLKDMEFGSDYKIGKKIYSSRCLIDKIKSKKYHLFLFYSVEKLGILSDYALKPLSQLLSCFNNMNKEVTFKVNANFIFKEKVYRGSISLPMKLPERSYFDEIRGMRFVKLTDNKKLFSFILDRPENKDYYMSIAFTYVGTINENLPSVILQKAVEISQEGKDG